MVAALQLFFWPVVILVFRLAPAWTPWTMALLFGSHFLPYWWIYRSRAYAFLALSLAASMSGGAVWRGESFSTGVPVVAAACYAITVLLLVSELKGWRVARVPEVGETHPAIR
jgi:hypothetical protein